MGIPDEHVVWVAAMSEARPPNKRLQRTRRSRLLFVSCMGKPPAACPFAAADLLRLVSRVSAGG
jgi:hypothetical protein